jgi:signal transduction histidine kinase
LNNRVKQRNILTLLLKSESDILTARRRARQVALVLGFNAQDQTRISTAVSEIVRNAVVHAGGGKVDFCVDDSKPPYVLAINVSDRGPGIPDVENFPDEHDVQTGFACARRLVDSLKIEPSEHGGSTVLIEKVLPSRLYPFSAHEIDALAATLSKVVVVSPLDEAQQQNQELLVALDLLSQKQRQLDFAYSELKLRNADLSKANSEIQTLNDSLEIKVAERTKELARARDEAIRANELKSQFVANISHEIRTPMSGILGLSELLCDELTGESQETARYVHKSAQDLMKLVNDLLDMSKLEAGKIEMQKEVFEVDEIVSDVLMAFNVSASSKDIVLRKNMHSFPPGKVGGFGSRIRQVLQNLVQNAIKFTDAGSVTVSVTETHLEDTVSYVKFSVNDTGPGISEEDQKKLFQLFVQVDGSTTRRYGGTGLGLALSKRFVELMGGAIGIESTVGVGSTFWFTIPIDTEGVQCQIQSP